jgi:hypothetical protein
MASCARSTRSGLATKTEKERASGIDHVSAGPITDWKKRGRNQSAPPFYQFGARASKGRRAVRPKTFARRFSSQEMLAEGVDGRADLITWGSC